MIFITHLCIFSYETKKWNFIYLFPTLVNPLLFRNGNQTNIFSFMAHIWCRRKTNNSILFLGIHVALLKEPLNSQLTFQNSTRPFFKSTCPLQTCHASFTDTHATHVFFFSFNFFFSLKVSRQNLQVWG